MPDEYLSATSPSSTVTMVTLTLTQLPPELVGHVLSFLDPPDLPIVSLTCRYLYNTIKDNTTLFRALYLNNLVSSEAVDGAQTRSWETRVAYTKTQ